MNQTIDLKGYENVHAVMPGEFPKLPPGGYICQVVHAEFTNSKAGNPMLVLFLDIAEGEFKGHFKDAFDRIKNSRTDIKWDNSAIYRQLIFDNSTNNVSRFFKGLLTCFQKSSPNISFNPHAFNSDTLRGCLIGFVFAEEEYERNGSVYTRVFPKFPKPVDDIRNNNFSIPTIKKLSSTPTTKPTKDDPFGGSPVDDFEVPF